MTEIQWYIDKKLTHQIHTSERKAFRACRRRWDWVYRDYYYPIVTPSPLEFGVAFHKAMEYFYEPDMWTSEPYVRRDLAVVAFKQECDAQLRRYKKHFPDPEVDVLDDYNERIDLGIGMIRYYCNEVAPKYDHGFTPIRVEVPFEVPIKNPDTGEQLWCNCQTCWSRYLKFNNYNPTPADYPKWTGLPVTYAGRLDMLAQDWQERYWIFDWKTTARILDEDAEASFLQLDDQITSYVWALSELGIHCAGFVYVEFKKAYPKPPKLLKRKYEGRAVSVDRSALTTPTMYIRAVQENDIDAWQMGLYDDHIRWLKEDGPVFTQRHQIHRNHYEIKSAGINIANEAMDMINRPRIYPQPGRFSCNWCLFKQPCIGKNMNEDYQYTLNTMFEKKSYHYWELEAPSTE